MAEVTEKVENKVLALSNIQSLSPSVLEPLMKKQSKENQTEELPLLQNHYNVKGSLEDQIEKVRGAFNKVSYERYVEEKEPESDWYWDAYILAIMERSIIVTLYRGYNTYEYYEISYSVNGDSVTFDFDNKKQVSVNLVVSALGIGQGTENKPKEKTQSADEGETDPNSDPDVDDLNPVCPECGGAMEEKKCTQCGKKMQSENTASEEPVQQEERTEEMETIEQAIERVHNNNPARLIQSKAEVQILKQATENTESGGKQVRIQGVATIGDIVNANGVVYPTTVWEKNLPLMNSQAKLGKFVGKVEHPDEDLGLQDIAIKFEDKFSLDGDQLLFEAVVIPTEPWGKNLIALLEAGVSVDISSRGYGSIKQEEWKGTKRPVVQDDFICVAFDAVMHGASTGSRITDVDLQSVQSTEKTEQTQEGQKTMENTQENKPNSEQPVTQSVEEIRQAEAKKKADALNQSAEFANTRKNLIAQAEGELSPAGIAAYQNALNRVDAGNYVALMEQSEAILPVLKETFSRSTVSQEETKAVTSFPGVWVKQSKEELAPKTGMEMIGRLVSGLNDTVAGKSFRANNAPNARYQSLEDAMKQVLVNVANTNINGFNGYSALQTLMLLEAGRVQQAVDLNQSFSADSVVANGNADPGGAPLSNYLIFPLVTRLYPKLIINEIASIQPMNVPDGKIFYLDHYRTNDPTSGITKRLDLNTSSNPFNSSYADNEVEGATSNKLKFGLQSTSVRATTKKLSGQFSAEEWQDLRAYHGLDAAQILMDGITREIAIERNLEVLNAMLAASAGGSLTFGTTPPASGFDNQADWDAYIWVYLSALENKIFANRYGNMTHLVVGMDAALALAKTTRGAFSITSGGDPDSLEGPYPGTTFFGVINAPNGSRYKVFKTNFWASGTSNGSKMMGLRRGGEFGDTPFIYAPYTTYVTPLFVDPEDISMKQAVMDRAAKKVVVPEAIVTLTVNNGQGVVL